MVAARARTNPPQDRRHTLVHHSLARALSSYYVRRLLTVGVYIPKSNKECKAITKNHAKYNQYALEYILQYVYNAAFPNLLLTGVLSCPN